MFLLRKKKVESNYYPLETLPLTDKHLREYNVKLCVFKKMVNEAVFSICIDLNINFKQKKRLRS